MKKLFLFCAALCMVASAVASDGGCGDALCWTYTPTDSTLTISVAIGDNGTMNDYFYEYDSYEKATITTAPWQIYYDRIKTLFINVPLKSKRVL